jgi:hypothetical protein
MIGEARKSRTKNLLTQNRRAEANAPAEFFKNPAMADYGGGE